MSPEHRMLAWEQWRQTRAYLILPLFVVVVGLASRSIARSEGVTARDMLLLADWYVLGTLVLAACVFCLHFDRRMTLQLGVPQRTFRLPVSSATLAGVQLGFRLAIVVAVFAVSLLLHRLIIGPETVLVFGGTMAFLLGFHALALGTVGFIQPCGPGAKAKMLTPLLIFAAVVAYPSWNAATAAPWFYALATVAPGIALAVFGHRLARHGGVQWTWSAGSRKETALYGSVADIPRFDTPADAQHWLEMRRNFWILPAVSALCSLAMFRSGFGLEHWHPLQSPSNTPMLYLGLLFPAALFGMVLAYKDYRLRDSPFGRFLFTRPASPSMLARARVIMAVKSMAAALGVVIAASCLGWLLLVSLHYRSHYPFHYLFRRADDPLPALVQVLTDWGFFLALAFGLVFAFSRSILYAIAFMAPVALLVWLLAGFRAEEDLLLIGDISMVLALLTVTAIALITKVQHPRLVHGVLGGIIATFVLVALYGFSGYPSAHLNQLGAYVPPREVLPGFGVLLALMAYSSVALAMHRRRSGSLFAPALMRGAAYLGARRRIVAGWCTALLAVALVQGVYLERSKTAAARSMLKSLAPGIPSPGLHRMAADALAPHLSEKQDPWQLDESDWRRVQEAHPYRALDFRHRDLSRFQGIIHLPDFPAPGTPLTAEAVRGTDLEDGALRATVEELLHTRQERAPLTLEEAAHFHYFQIPNAHLEQFVALEIWQLADEGRMDAAWARFLALLEHNADYNAPPSVAAQHSRYQRNSFAARSFNHLLVSAPPERAQLEAVLARLPEDYSYASLALPVFAATVQNYRLFEGFRSPRDLRQDRETGEYTFDRQPLYGQALDYLTYAGSGLKQHDRFIYLQTAYHRLSHSRAASPPPAQWQTYFLGQSPVSRPIIGQLSSVYYSALLGQISEQLMRTAAAAALYERDTGRLPANLAALRPKYLPQLPADPLASHRDAMEGLVEATREPAEDWDHRHPERPVPAFRYRILSEREAVVSIGEHRGRADKGHRESDHEPGGPTVLWIPAWGGSSAE